MTNKEFASIKPGETVVVIKGPEPHYFHGFSVGQKVVYTGDAYYPDHKPFMSDDGLEQTLYPRHVAFIGTEITN